MARGSASLSPRAHVLCPCAETSEGHFCGDRALLCSRGAVCGGCGVPLQGHVACLKHRHKGKTKATGRVLRPWEVHPASNTATSSAWHGSSAVLRPREPDEPGYADGETLLRDALQDPSSSKAWSLPQAANNKSGCWRKALFGAAGSTKILVCKGRSRYQYLASGCAK